MIYPVTPNGVEHTFSNEYLQAEKSVIYPVTPNGVERIDREAVIPATLRFGRSMIGYCYVCQKASCPVTQDNRLSREVNAPCHGYVDRRKSF